MNYTARLKRLRDLLKLTPCDALLIEHPINLLYLTGIELSAGYLLVGLNETCLIVDGRYYEKCGQQTLYPISLLNPTSLKKWLETSQIQKLGFDQETTTYQRYTDLLSLVHTISGLELLPYPSLVQKLRLIKDGDELTYLRQAASLGYRGYEYVASLLKEGVRENELALELEFFWKKQGAQRLAFDSIIAFGENSSMPHYRASSTQLTSNQIVLIDIGVVLNHYNSDMTRVVFFGEPKKELLKIYDIVQEAKERALALCRSGTSVGELDRAARDYIASQGYGDYFSHSLGHGVGLDIHEMPTIRQTGPSSSLLLEPGMVITIEPGIYLPGVGGVRLEDTIAIQETGYENFTHF